MSEYLITKAELPESELICTVCLEVSSVPNCDRSETDKFLDVVVSILRKAQRRDDDYPKYIELLCCAMPNKNSITGYTQHFYICLHGVGNSNNTRQIKKDIDGKVIVIVNFLKRKGFKLTSLSGDKIGNVYKNLSKCKNFTLQKNDGAEKTVTIEDNVVDKLLFHLPHSSGTTGISFLLFRGRDNKLKASVAIFTDNKVETLCSIISSNLCGGRTPITHDKYINIIFKIAEDNYHHNNIISNEDDLIRLTKLPTGNRCGLNVNNQEIDGNVSLPSGYINSQENGLVIGKFVDNDKSILTLPEQQLQYHMSIIGKTGSGKSCLLANIMQEIHRVNYNFLVLDLEGSQFRRLASQTEAAVFTCSGTCKLSINPFAIKGFSKDDNCALMRVFLSEATNINENDGGPLSQYVTDVTNFYFASNESRLSYENFMKNIDHIFNNINNYAPDVSQNMRAALNTRLRKMQYLNGIAPFDANKLLGQNCIFELKDLKDNEERSLVLLFVLMAIFEVKKKGYGIGKLRPTILIIDEIHLILAGNHQNGPAKKGVQNILERICSEGRKYGLYLCIADQKYGVIKQYFDNVGTNIVLRSPYDETMQPRWESYDKEMTELPIGQGLLLNSESRKIIRFQANSPNAAFDKNLDDSTLEQYMKRKYMRLLTRQTNANENETENETIQAIINKVRDDIICKINIALLAGEDDVQLKIKKKRTYDDVVKAVYGKYCTKYPNFAKDLRKELISSQILKFLGTFSNDKHLSNK